ncbi:hypothetical protein DTO012A9_10114 [Penicillium roqueforti]|uniref:Fungal trichothecene efflux pump n=1 Tax=Penicillium roqueforti (strain FM164) TaxID=1365484 RepID=W6QPL2_PENRF|nr:hypothetical protein DTO012A9_10114 [Penicillium roqueforti]CDM31522.1 Fungal trichothecene efflux pump [Penicillium roqueforti FM164]
MLPPTDPETGQRNRKPKPLAFYLAFIALLLMVFLVSLDATMLAVAIPAITDELFGTTLTAFWANISFTVAIVVIQPIYTSFSDICGLLIVGRVLQGLGGGGLDVLSEVIVADITTLQERAVYIGLLSLPMATGCIAGPILGAVFIGIALFLAIFFMRLRPIDQSLRSQLGRIDWLGMLLFTAGCVLFALPLSWAGNMYTWGSFRTIVPLIIGVLILVGFAFYEGYQTDAVFRYRSRTAQMSLLGSFIHGFVLYTLLQYLPLFFQAVYLESPLKS